MELDNNRIDDAVLALLMLGVSGNRAWRGFDAEAISRLHERGFIEEPQSKSLSLVFTPQGLARGKKMMEEMFAKK